MTKLLEQKREGKSREAGESPIVDKRFLWALVLTTFRGAAISHLSNCQKVVKLDPKNGFFSSFFQKSGHRSQNMQFERLGAFQKHNMPEGNLTSSVQVNIVIAQRTNSRWRPYRDRRWLGGWAVEPE